MRTLQKNIYLHATVNQTINVQQLHLTNLWIFQETQFELCINLQIFLTTPDSGNDNHSSFLSLKFFNRTNLHVCDVSLAKKSPYFLNLKTSTTATHDYKARNSFNLD